MKRVVFLLGMALPIVAIACSGSQNDPSGSNGENLNWRGWEDGAVPAFDGALPPFPGLGAHADGGFPFAIPDSGFPFEFPDGAPPFDLPDGGFGSPPPWFKWPDGKFHVEPCDGGFKFALPGGGFACPEAGGKFSFEGLDAGFEPPPEWSDSGFVLPIPGEPRLPDSGHEEPPPPKGRP